MTRADQLAARKVKAATWYDLHKPLALGGAGLSFADIAGLERIRVTRQHVAATVREFYPAAPRTKKDTEPTMLKLSKPAREVLDKQPAGARSEYASAAIISHKKG